MWHNTWQCLAFQYHVYQVVWENPTSREELCCRCEVGNSHDPFAVAVIKWIDGDKTCSSKAHITIQCMVAIGKCLPVSVFLIKLKALILIGGFSLKGSSLAIWSWFAKVFSFTVENITPVSHQYFKMLSIKDAAFILSWALSSNFVINFVFPLINGISTLNAPVTPSPLHAIPYPNSCSSFIRLSFVFNSRLSSNISTARRNMLAHSWYFRSMTSVVCFFLSLHLEKSLCWQRYCGHVKFSAVCGKSGKTTTRDDKCLVT